MKRISSFDVCIFLLALAGGTAAHAATYYVSSSLGLDENAGTSADAPWRSISRVNRAALATGDRVYFRVGDEWDDEFLTVDWSGTATQHAIVGAYRVNAGGDISYAAGPGNQRPVIDDHYRWGAGRFSASTGSNPALDVAGSYVDIQNIEVKRTGWGIRVRGVHQHQVTITHVFVNGAYQCGIQAKGVTDFTVQDSELFNAEAFNGLFDEPGNWCSSIGIQGSHNILVQNNYIHESFGEAINVFYGSTNAVIRDNLLYANRALGIYIGALNGARIYRNLVLGTADRRFWRSPGSVGPGIAMDNESYEFVGGSTTSGTQFTGNGSLCPLGAYGNYGGEHADLCPDALQNIDIYDNLVAGTASGLAVWYADYPAAYTNVRVFNNTLVDNRQQLTLGGQRASHFIVRNNIFLSLSPETLDVDGSNYGMTFDTNYWSQGKPPTVGSDPLSSADDLTAGADLARMTGWRSITDVHSIDAASFAPTRASATLGRGSAQGLFFAADYFGAALHQPLDLGAIVGSSDAAPARVMPAVAPPGSSVTVSGSFTPLISADGATLYFWLKHPDGHAIARAAISTDLTANLPAPVTATLTVPADAAPGSYRISVGAYAGAVALRPFVDEFAGVRVE